MPHDLLRFVEIQENVFDQALNELREGKSRGRWMPYLFPVLYAWENTEDNETFGFQSKREVKAFVNHPVLGQRLRTLARTLFMYEGKTAKEIFDEHDANQLFACMTLFAEIADDNVIFIEVLRKFFEGEKEYRTLYLLQFLKA